MLEHSDNPDPRIIVIGIDDASIDAVGQWPWPRSYMANMINKLTELKVATIGVDILYDAPSGDDESDRLLAEAIANSKRVVLASAGVFNQSQMVDKNAKGLAVDSFIFPYEPFLQHAYVGHVNVFTDYTGGINVGANSDGVMRKAIKSIFYNNDFSNEPLEVFSFPVKIYQVYCDMTGTDKILPSGEVSPLVQQVPEIPTDKFGRYYIDFVGGPDTFTTLSFASVLNDEYPPEIFEDAIVLIGPHAIGVGTDNYPTSLDVQNPMYGVEIHANTVQTLLNKSFKASAPEYVNIILLAIWIALAYFLFSRLNPYISAASMMVVLATQIMIAKIAYNSFDAVLYMFYPSVAVILLYVMNLAYRFILEQREKRYVTGIFGRFVAPEVVKEMLSGGVSIELGGSLRDVSVLFVDIRGFTTFSEVTPPPIVVEILNKYLTVTSNAILNNKGTLDKFIGDATMAVFNSPNELADHAFHAVCAAWEMQKNAAPIQKEIKDQYGIDLKFGIGVNTGPAVIGNIGSSFRMDYTVIGDTVNTAARLESNAKGNEIIISESVYEKVADRVAVTPLGNLSVKGKQTEIVVYRLDDIKGDAIHGKK